MEKSVQKRKNLKQSIDPLQELQHTLLGLQDDLSETMAWTSLVCDGLSGILVENGSDIDPTTQTGVRFATIWLKRRNENHVVTLRAACTKLREIRGQ